MHCSAIAVPCRCHCAFSYRAKSAPPFVAIVCARGVHHHYGDMILRMPNRKSVSLKVFKRTDRFIAKEHNTTHMRTNFQTDAMQRVDTRMHGYRSLAGWLAGWQTMGWQSEAAQPQPLIYLYVECIWHCIGAQNTVSP